jgi:shikimate kinase
LCPVRFESRKQIIKTDFKNLDAVIEWMRAEMEAGCKEMKGHQERTLVIFSAGLEEMKAVAEQREVGYEEAEVDPIRALKD